MLTATKPKPVLLGYLSNKPTVCKPTICKSKGKLNKGNQHGLIIIGQLIPEPLRSRETQVTLQKTQELSQHSSTWARSLHMWAGIAHAGAILTKLEEGGGSSSSLKSWHGCSLRLEVGIHSTRSQSAGGGNLQASSLRPWHPIRPAPSRPATSTAHTVRMLRALGPRASQLPQH